MSDSLRVRRTASLVVALVLLLPTWSGEAHEIPADVTVQAFIKPEGNTIRTLVRVPLVSMRDYAFPTREPGYLLIEESGALIRNAAIEWIRNFVRMYENGESLGFAEVRAARVAIPGDRAFQSYETALANALSPPLPEDTELPPEQAMLDVLLEWPIGSETSDFSIDSGWAQLGIRTLTVLRFLPAGGSERAFQYTGSEGLVRLDPRWHHAAWRFVVLGFDHILDGIDHLLFLFCLVVPFRSFWALVPIVTSFTIAHSITLIASALGLAPNALWFPPLIETLIALSIVFMAFENIIGAKLERRWLIAFGFGLVHGFGFSFALSESLQFAGAHLLTSLLSFNVGVELGQLFVLALTVPLLDLLFRRWLPELLGTIALSAFLAHTGWHWMTERGGELLQYNFTVPAPSFSLAATLLRWIMLALIVVGAAWILRAVFRLLPGATGAGARAAARRSPERGASEDGKEPLRAGS
ncbi:MAG TPA: HupE/UreJ family protein [Longimicrobiales bacterium]|nr:HupE/UreJ family protein [Longimicrobiales bacterium]